MLKNIKLDLPHLPVTPNFQPTNQDLWNRFDNALKTELATLSPSQGKSWFTKAEMDIIHQHYHQLEIQNTGAGSNVEASTHLRDAVSVLSSTIKMAREKVSSCCFHRLFCFTSP